MRALAAEHGVRLLSLHPPILPLPGWTRLATLTDLLADWAAALDVPLVTLHTPRLASLATEPGEALPGAGPRPRRAPAGRGVPAGAGESRPLLPEHRVECLDRPGDLLALAQEWQAGITFDTAHAGTMCSGHPGGL